MAVEEVVRRVLVDEHADVLREALGLLVRELMEVEVSELVGAELGERRPEDRATHRNGYRTRRWDTRAGEIELQIPKLRQGSYFPGFLKPRKRSEQALVSVVQQAYVCGVSTRRVDQLVESLGLRVSRSEVSRICALLDEQVEAFRERPLEGRYPYLFVDAKVEKVRDGGRVQRKCVVVAHAVHETGGREIIGLDVGEAETEAFWRAFLRSLVIHEGAGPCQGAVTGLGRWAAWANGVAETFQSSIRSRCADQSALRNSGAQSSGRPSGLVGGHDKQRARPSIRIASVADGADQAGGGTHEEAAMNTCALGRQRRARQRISPSRRP